MSDSLPTKQITILLGFHAHHPRNCLFYLRDKKAADLETLLKLNKIDYEIKDFDTTKLECDVMEQKETETGLKDEPCRREVEKFGICALHYIEHLAKLIKRNQIDVLQILGNHSLKEHLNSIISSLFFFLNF